MAAAELDVSRLASFVNVSADAVTALLSAPTIDLVASVLSKVAEKARDYEESQSSKLRLKVELENAMRSGDAKSRAIKSSLDKTLEENARLRQQLQDEESSRQALALELQSVKSSTSASDSETSRLQIRIASLEGSLRDTLALLEKKSSACDDLANELSIKHQKVVELRRDITSTEQTLSAANTSLTSCKLREQDAQQEAESLKRHNEWLDQELTTKSAEYSRFRKEKSARISELQQQNEDAMTNIESLQRIEKSLRARLQEVNERAEEYSTHMHNLREENARNVENLKAEIETGNRLTDLLKTSLDTERQRHQDLSCQLDEAKESAADEIGRISTEIEREHQEREAAERRIIELEVQIERLEVDARLPADPGESLGTPRSRGNASNINTPRRGSASRAMTPLTGGVRGGINYTQLITDYHLAKNEFDNERRRNEKLSSTIDEMIRDMELRQPEITELQTDHKRLESDILEMSGLVDTVGKERDQAKKEARRWERQVAGLTREGEVLRQQLRDLSSQVKILLMEVNSQNEGLEGFTQEERARLETLAKGDLDSELSETTTDTNRFIGQHLTTFRNLAELQEQNQRLLRVTRELGEKMEGEEAQAAKAQAAQNQEELDDLRQRFERSKEEIKILMTQSQSYIKERDMFRRMLSHRGQLPAGADLAALFGESVNNSQPPATPTQNGVSLMSAHSPSTKDVAEFTKALKELQAQYDNYRQEAATHQSIIREQSDALSKQNGELRTEVSRKTSEATLAVDRYEMLNGNYAMLKNENEELRKRSQNVSERLTKQEIRTQQVVEDLVEAKGLAESLRNEAANLKAEKDFWKTVEKRLNEDNASLVADRERLNMLNANVQNILNEREHSESETRRRLQSQLEALENELQVTKRKLQEEVEENKRAALRREYDSQQSASRIEDLMTNLGAVREELVAAKTTREHLQARADELTVELRSAQERLDVLQLRSSSQNGELQDQERAVTQGDVSREQELSLEISEMRRDLELAQKELADNKYLIDQYKAISQSSEEELQSLNETHDQYRIETDSAIEEKNGKIKELEGIIENIRSELSSVNAELQAVQTQSAEHSRRTEEQKTKHETEVGQLKDQIERAEAAAYYHQEDLKKQAEIAQQAQQNYDFELVKHAEAAKAVQKIRGELNELRLENVELRASSEAAQAKITQNDESWAEARERYERELADIRSRKEDMAAQNRTLHDQLEKVNSQIADLRNKHTLPVTATEDAPSSSGTNDGTDNLQNLIKYLRQEKDIVETQYLRSSQESKRLRQQLDHTQQQLDDARLKLVQEHRAQENSERQILNHNKLMETLEELNLYRESNSTLRLEKTQVQKALDDRTSTVSQLQAQIQPLQAKVTELEDAKEMQEAELRMAQEAKDRFEKRYLDVLNRSNAVDPADLENAQQRVVELETELGQLSETRDALQVQVDEFPNRIKQELQSANERFSETRAKLIEQSKNKARDQNAKIKERDAALQQASQDKQELDSQLTSFKEQLLSLQDELNDVMTAKDGALSALSQRPVPSETVDNSTQKDNEDTEEPSSDPVELQSLREQLDAANARVASEGAQAVEVQMGLATAQSRVVNLEREMASLQQSLNQAQAQIADLETQRSSSNEAKDSELAITRATGDAGEDETSETLRQELRRLTEEADQLRFKLSAFERAENVQEEGSISVAEQIAGQVEEIGKELTARHEARVKQAEEKYNARAQSMKELLNKRLATSRSEMQQKIEASNAEAVEAIKQQLSAEIEALKQRHSEEIAELQRHDVPNRLADAVEGSSQTSPWEPTEADVRNMLQNNALCRRLVQNSLSNRERIVREEEQQKIKEQLADIENRIAKAKKDAEGMVEAKFAAKFNLTENRMKAAQAKVEYVQTAARETPDKTIGEVWTAAKDVKPAVPAPKPTTADQSSSTVPATQGQPAGSPGVGSASTSQGDSSALAPAATVQPDPSKSGDRPNPFATEATQTPASQASNDGQRTTGPKAETATPQKQAQAALQRPSRVPSLQQSSHAPQAATGQVGHQASTTNGTATGPSAGGAGNVKGQQSGLPVASGVRGGPQGRGGPQRGQRGSNIARGGGRGSGIGRGAIQAVNTALAQSVPSGPRGQGSPQGGKGMNGSAQQFIPQKRTREDSGLETSQYAGDEKRFRGEGT